jgi:hypothetical protein
MNRVSKRKKKLKIDNYFFFLFYAVMSYMKANSAIWPVKWLLIFS